MNDDRGKEADHISTETILEGIAEAVVVITSDNRIRTCNRHFAQMLGYDQDELLGMDSSALYAAAGEHPPSADAAGDDAQGGIGTDRTIHFRHKSGAAVPLEVRVAELRDARGNPVAEVIATKGPNTELERHKEIETLARISESIPIPVVSISIDGNLLYANRESWILLDQWKTSVGRPVPHSWRRIVREVGAQRETHRIEVQIGFKTMLLLVVPVSDSGYVTVFGLDVTTRKRAERRLLQDSRIFENVSEGMMIVDADGRIVEVNRSFCTITGYSQEDVLGENFRILGSGPDNDGIYEEMLRSLQERGNWQGEVWERRKNGEIYPKWVSISGVSSEGGKLTRFVCLFSDISAAKQTQEQLYHMAHYDSLTGVPNRRYFLDRLEGTLDEARRAKEQVAVMFIDVDGFKLINDNFGHRIGDQLLQEISDRIRDCVRESDTVSRIGGDEFTLILPKLRSPQSGAVVAQKVIQRVSRPANIEQHEIVVTTSIGIAIFPDDAIDADTLVQNADAAMYRAKETGKNHYQFFSPDMNRRAMERLLLQTQLRSGLQGEEFVAYFQPQIVASTGRLAALEALVRWQKDDGLVGPDLFIPFAEESGIVTQIGERVLRLACRHASDWLREGLPPVRIAVNLSAIQLRQPRFVATVRDVLEETGIPASLLELELTEGTLLDDDAETLSKLRSLKAMGLCLAIDDFGTKYSSLAYLQRLPIDRIKIDRSFTRDLPEERASVEIASAIIAMGRSLNLEVVAEGVETRPQALFLRDRGCHYLQGFYFGEPVSAEGARALLEREMRGEGGAVDFPG